MQEHQQEHITKENILLTFPFTPLNLYPVADLKYICATCANRNMLRDYCSCKLATLRTKWITVTV